MQFNPGDMVQYSYWEDDGVENWFVVLYGLVFRGGQHNALVLLNGRTEAGWISDEYLEVIHESR
jgi:hypothetical protein